MYVYDKSLAITVPAIHLESEERRGCPWIISANIRLCASCGDSGDGTALTEARLGAMAFQWRPRRPCPEGTAPRQSDPLQPNIYHIEPIDEEFFTSCQTMPGRDDLTISVQTSSPGSDRDPYWQLSLA